MVDVVTQEDFEAAVTALQAQIAAVDAKVKSMPAEIKTQFVAVLEWMKANV